MIGGGCCLIHVVPSSGLFNIELDPSEYTDLAATMPSVLARLNAALDAAMLTAYQTNDTPGYNNCTTSNAWAKAHEGFLGPPCVLGSNDTRVVPAVVVPDLTPDELAEDEIRQNIEFASKRRT